MAAGQQYYPTVGAGSVGNEVSPAPREVTMRERVMQHEQRIFALETELQNAHDRISQLTQALIDQVGIVPPPPPQPLAGLGQPPIR